MKIEKKIRLWPYVDGLCCGKKAGGRIKRAASGHRKHFAGPGKQPFFPPKVFFFSARKTNYQETLNSREREKLESAQDQ